MKIKPRPATKASATAAKPATKSLFDAWHDLVAPDDIIEVGRRLGVIKRQRKIDLPALVAATIGAVSPVPGSETSALVNYLQLVGAGEDEAKIALSSLNETALRAVAVESREHADRCSLAQTHSEESEETGRLVMIVALEEGPELLHLISR
jgi:hypothetical protein